MIYLQYMKMEFLYVIDYSKQNFDNKEYNFLEIKVSEKAFGSKSILISTSQMALIDEFFKSKNINKVRHF